MTGGRDTHHHAEALDIRIGLARPAELPDIWELYRRTFLDTYADDEASITTKMLADFLETDSPYFPKNWQKDLAAPSRERTVFVARHEGKIVGMVAPVFVDDKYRITALYVAPEAQDMGVGTKLMRAALSHLGNVDINIGVASHIKWLQGFYEQFGFRLMEPRQTIKTPPDPVAYIQMIRPSD